MLVGTQTEVANTTLAAQKNWWREPQVPAHERKKLYPPTNGWNIDKRLTEHENIHTAIWETEQKLQRVKKLLHDTISIKISNLMLATKSCSDAIIRERRFDCVRLESLQGVTHGTR